MPSAWHDSVVRLAELNPQSIVGVLRDILREPIPAGVPVVVAPKNFNDRPSQDFDCDAVLIAGPHHDPVRGIILEAQRAAVEGKRQVFAKYAAQLWALLGCPVDVVVICQDEKTAAFYERPFRTSLPGYIHTPRPLHPASVPAITDPGQMAADPGRAVLSVAFHGDKPGVAEAFLNGMRMLHDQGTLYNEIGIGLATLPARRRMEELMATKWLVNSDFAKKHYGEGKTEGKTEGQAAGEADAIRLVLQARGIPVSPEQRSRIDSCTDIEQLRTWVTRAVTISDASQLFG